MLYSDAFRAMAARFVHRENVGGGWNLFLIRLGMGAWIVVFVSFFDRVETLCGEEIRGCRGGASE